MAETAPFSRRVQAPRPLWRGEVCEGVKWAGLDGPLGSWGSVHHDGAAWRFFLGFYAGALGCVRR